MSTHGDGLLFAVRLTSTRRRWSRVVWNGVPFTGRRNSGMRMRRDSTKRTLNYSSQSLTQSALHTHAHLKALCPGLPGWAGTRKVKPIWILLKQETVSGSRISWDICKSATRTRQITTPAPHHSVFYSPDALPAAQPTASKHWRHRSVHISCWLLSLMNDESKGPFTHFCTCLMWTQHLTEWRHWVSLVLWSSW